MSIQFDVIPSDILLPLVYMEFSGRAPTSAGSLINPTVLLGQKRSTGTATAGARTRVQSASDAAGLFGQGSILHRMAIKFFAANPGGDLYAIPLADAAGTSATVTITVTVTTAEAGTLHLRIGDTYVPVAVTAGEAQNDIATAIDAAIDALPDLAATSGAAANVVTLTSRHAGTVGNLLAVTLNALGQAGGEVTPGGVTCTIATTYPVNGATDPTESSWITGMANDPYDVVCLSILTSGMMSAIKTEMARRWGPLVGVEGHAIGCLFDSAADLETYAAARNDKHLSIFGVKENVNFLTPAYEMAASLAGIASLYLGNDPGAPLQGVVLPGVWGYPTSNFTVTERQDLAEAGIGTLTVQGGDVYIEAETTTYTLDANSVSDLAWQYIQNPFLLQRFKRRVKARLVSRFPRFKLADDGNPTKAGQRVTTPKTIKGEVVAEYSDMVGDGLVENIEAFKSSLIVERNATNRNRVDVLARPDLINQLRVIAIRTEFEV